MLKIQNQKKIKTQNQNNNKKNCFQFLKTIFFIKKVATMATESGAANLKVLDKFLLK